MGWERRIRLLVPRAESEIATRGLVVIVVQAYYGYVVAERKYGTAQKAAAAVS